MISVQEAVHQLEALLPSPVSELVALDECHGRVLFRAIVADRDAPPYHRVAMDGYAVDSSEGLRSWQCGGLQLAGHPPLSRTAAGTAIEVATGAVLPAGCDAVIPYEKSTPGDIVELLADQPMPRPGQHIHAQGDAYRSGQTLLNPGTLLRSPHLHVLATEGVTQVPVQRRARWALVATGDELVEVGAQPLPWQIRRSNAAAIAGEARSWGYQPVQQLVLRDDPVEMEARLSPLLAELDVLVLTGGVSAGRLDVVPDVLQRLGVTTLFHRIAQRPGKPLWCGRGHEGQLVFGLPGNPVSSLFSFRRYVLPWLQAFEGKDSVVRRVALPVALKRETHQTLFLPWNEKSGVLAWTNSGDFSALTESDGFLQLDSEADGSNTAPYFPWGGGF